MLNSELIRQRRGDLNMSNREVARQLRVTAAVIKRLEEGSNHEWIALGEVARLASILSIEFGDMFSPELVEAPDVRNTAADRAAELGALLYEMGKLVPRSALCQALECSPDELDDALTELAAVLAPAGMTIHSSKDSVSIEAVADINPDHVESLIRSQLSSRGLTITDANILAEIAEGMHAQRKLSNHENRALQRLRKAGIVEGDRQELTVAARESLLL